MIRVFTPYLANFEYSQKKYLATLDRGVVVYTTTRDDFPEHDAELISSFRKAYNFEQHLTVIREYGFPTLMRDSEGLALSLGALAVHMGFEERVSAALRRFTPRLLDGQSRLLPQYMGGVYVDDGGGLKRVILDGDLRVVAVKRDRSVSFLPIQRAQLLSSVMELVAKLSAANVRVYSTNTLGTTVYVTGGGDRKPTL
ncbi:MAG: hypothetical protein QW514_02255 [Thermoprotei archaeon]